MKSYSKKQANVIFANVKNGKLQAPENFARTLYAYADLYSMNWQQFELDMVRAIRNAVSAIFDNDIKEAQYQLDNFFAIEAIRLH